MNGDRRRKDDKAAGMYALYQQGLSTRQVAALFGCSGDSVHQMFKRRKWTMRPGPRAISRRMWKAVTYKGKRYTPEKDGYLRCTSPVNGRRLSVFLHRVIWEEHHGPIPTHQCVSFKDGDRSNCAIENLELLDRCQVQSAKGAGNNQYTRGLERRAYPAKSCPVCGKAMRPHDYEAPSAFMKRRCCGFACGRAWLKGKPRGTRRATLDWRKTVTARVDPRLRAIAAARQGTAGGWISNNNGAKG